VNLINTYTKLQQHFIHFFSGGKNEVASKKYGALFSVAYEALQASKETGDVYRVHRLILWASTDYGFQKLLFNNELLRCAYNECINYYSYIDFLDLDVDTNLDERKIGLYSNLIMTCITRFPDTVDESYKETVKRNFDTFLKLALK
jgi:hypothetical protein